MSFLSRIFRGSKSGEPEPAEPVVWPVITEADFQALLDEEAAGVSGWIEVKNEKNVKVWKSKIEGSVYPVKAVFTLPDVPPDVAFQLMHNAALRTEWDKFYQEYSILGRVDEMNEYLYQAMKGPTGITGRDFVLYRGVRTDHKNKVYQLVFKNAAHELRPVTSTYVRAQCIRSGYVIRPSPDDPRSCQMFVISQNDVKGSLPKWLINAVAPRGVQQWYANFYRACQMLRSRLEALAHAAAADADAAAGQAAAAAADTVPNTEALLERAAVHLDAQFDALDLTADEATMQAMSEDAATPSAPATPATPQRGL